MSESDLYSALKNLAGGQVYPYVAPLGSDGKPSVSPPWVIFSIVSDVSGDVFCGQAESRASVQIDVYSLNITEANTIRDNALVAMHPLQPASVARTTGYEPDFHYYRATLELTVIT